MKQMQCKHCKKEFTPQEEQPGDKIHCPHCHKYLYTVAPSQPNKYSKENPYHPPEPS